MKNKSRALFFSLLTYIGLVLLTACSGSGETPAGGSTSMENQATSPLISLKDTSNMFQSYAIVELSLDSSITMDDVESIVLSETSTVIPFFAAPEQTIILSLPYTADGGYTLQVKVSNQTYLIPIQVQNTVVSDAKTYISDFSDALASQDILYSDQIDEAKATVETYLPNLTEEEIGKIYLMLNAINEYIASVEQSTLNTASILMPKDELQCTETNLNRLGMLVTGSVAVSVVILDAAGLATLTGPAGFVAGALAFGTSLAILSKMMGEYDSFLSSCISAATDSIFEVDSLAKSASLNIITPPKIHLKNTGSTLSYIHGVSKEFQIETNYELGSTAKSLLLANTSKLVTFFNHSFVSNFIPASWVQTLEKANGYTKQEYGYKYNVVNISHPDIELCSKSGSLNLSLMFCFKAGSTHGETEVFSYTLVNSETGISTTQSATLTQSQLPQAFDMSIDVSVGVTELSVLKGFNADRFEILTQPMHGTVTLNSDLSGSFAYFTDAVGETADSFTFHTVNAFGKSAAKTVSVNISNKPAIKILVRDDEQQKTFELDSSYIEVTDWASFSVMLVANGDLQEISLLDLSSDDLADPVTGWSFTGWEWPELPNFVPNYSGNTSETLYLYDEGFSVGTTYKAKVVFTHTDGETLSKEFSFKLVNQVALSIKINEDGPLYSSCKNYKVNFDDQSTVYSGSDLGLTLGATVSSTSGEPIPNENIIWTSSKDGLLGKGASVTGFNLTPGSHQITVTATDTEKGLTSYDSFNLRIINQIPFTRETLTTELLNTWVTGGWYEYWGGLTNRFVYYPDGTFVRYDDVGIWYEGTYSVGLSSIEYLPDGADPDDYSYGYILHRITKQYGGVYLYIEPGVIANYPYFYKGVFKGTTGKHWENGSYDRYQIIGTNSISCEK